MSNNMSFRIKETLLRLGLIPVSVVYHDKTGRLIFKYIDGEAS